MRKMALQRIFIVLFLMVMIIRHDVNSCNPRPKPAIITTPASIGYKVPMCTQPGSSSYIGSAGRSLPPCKPGQNQYDVYTLPDPMLSRVQVSVVTASGGDISKLIPPVVNPRTISPSVTGPPGGSGTAVLDSKDQTDSTKIVAWSPIGGYVGVGCVTFGKGSVFSIGTNDVALLPPNLYTTPPKDGTIYECAEKCRNLGLYTYAGLEAGYEATCFCFNNFVGLSNGSCSACLYAVNNTIATIRNCRPDGDPQNIAMYVMSTCPQGYFGPPRCLDRAKSICGTLQARAMATANGTCTVCISTIENYPPGYMEQASQYHVRRDRCDLNSEFQWIEDFRIPTPVTKVYYQSAGIQGNYYFYLPDMTAGNNPDEMAGSQVIDKDKAINFINTKPRPHASTDFITESKLSRAVTIIDSSRVTSFLEPNRWFYIADFYFKAKAEGAFYFSIWDQVKPISYYNTITRLDLNVYQKDDFNPDYNAVFNLIAKYLIDVSRYDVHTIRNVMFPLYFNKFQTTKFGYHSLDTQKVWKGTGSLNENWQFNSLLCTTVYSYGFTGDSYSSQPSERTFKNRFKFDTIPGWSSGEQVSTARSDRPWWAAHEWEFLNKKDKLDSYPLQMTTSHYDDCPFKARLFVACHDFCQRQACDANDRCIYGCIQGYMGPQCRTTCPSQTYGQNCISNCSSGCQNKNCDSASGYCKDGCVPGRVGDTCVTVCSNGTYGPTCSLTCSRNCIDPLNCDAATGACAGGCTYGYLPPQCGSACTLGTYGINCSLVCGKCKGGETCDLTTGVCRAGCDGNYMPSYCKCLAGSWGDKCKNTCGMCKLGLPCRLADGVCDGNPLPGVNVIAPDLMCEPGFQPPKCVCRNNTWGDACQKVCGNCLAGFCMSDTGKCLVGCMPGYQGDFCDVKCGAGTWGTGCKQVCGSCNGGPNNCDPASGKCLSGCVTGFAPTQCVDCTAGAFDSKCDKACGLCRNDAPCNRDGSCPAPEIPRVLAPIGVGDITSIVDAINTADNAADTDALVAASRYTCKDGYQPVRCICKTGFYGDKCDQKCDNCIIGCLDSNGTCIGGCVSGFYGPTCNTSCRSGFFGPNCKKKCGYCFNGTVCTAADGICKQGCEPGYMLPTCLCSSGFFGQSCEKKCGNCADGTTCSFVDGSCQSGCKPGWKEPYCNCTIGTYRLDCSGKCGNCAGTNDCDFYTGACKYGCNASFNMPLCTEKCPPGKFGPGCYSSCGSCINCEICQPDTGVCTSGCEPGFLGSDCVKPCPSGFYGSQCKQKCGYCISGNPCNPADGVCDRGCVMGYLSPYCTQACPNKTWGFNCQNICGNCINGKNCNFLDGTCSDGCVVIYKPPFCVDMVNVTSQESASACKAGFYLPPTCATPCGKCMLGLPCHGLVGYCQSGCQPGYQPILCDKSCPDGSYGSNCLELCGKCGGTGSAAACRKTDGVCASGCQTGWFGDTCKYRSAEEAARAKSDSCDLRWSLLTFNTMCLGYFFTA